LSRLLFIFLLSFSLFCIGKPLTAKSWVVADTTGKIYDSQNIDEVRPIASITKLLTILTVLDAKQDLTEVLTLTTKLRDKLPRKNQKITRKSLIEMALVSSDNRASLTLCENYPNGYNACILAMNNKAKSIGMINTSVVEPTGLDKDNVSTARDLITLARDAMTYREVTEFSKEYQTRILVNDSWVSFTNTNPLVEKNHNIVVSKTGWTFLAGGCLMMTINDRIIIVLGSRSTKTRVPEVEQLFRQYD
jgi:serine-type D-Ala-D-Ala endopeptidase (penicillin-binding protein 7)